MVNFLTKFIMRVALVDGLQVLIIDNLIWTCGDPVFRGVVCSAEILCSPLSRTSISKDEFIGAKATFNVLILPLILYRGCSKSTFLIKRMNVIMLLKRIIEIVNRRPC
jgi:hypothetical protein